MSAAAAPSTENRSLLLVVMLVVAVAAAARALLLASGSVSFHSDEAIVGLMARHILAGQPPTFFYGQAYMGSLDAWLVAFGFRLLGESVLTIRLVQSALWLGVVASAVWAAAALTRSRTAALTRSRTAALITGLCFAVGTPLLALYTTATLGGYNETLLFGHLLVALAAGRARSLWRWALFGLIAGAGWWTNALIVVYLVPIALLLAWEWRVERVPPLRPAALAVIAAAFVVGSAPWWLYALANDLAPVRFFLPDLLGGRETVGAVIPSVPWDQRLIGLFLLGLPTVIGLRFPWAGDFFAPLVGLALLACYAAALYALGRARPGDHTARRLAAFTFSMIASLCALFLLTRFSSDPSGRYFLPLTLPVMTALAWWVARLPRPALLIVALVLAYHAAGQVTAARTTPGFTTQFVAQTHLPNDDDDALIAWLDAHDLRHGYTTYWVSFRIAFLSGERIQLSAALPDKSDLQYTPAFERYPPYRAATDASPRIAYITAMVPELDAALAERFAAAGVTYATAQVGIYRIYYDFVPTPPRP